MAALDTVADYLADARVLLQDQVEPYRYASPELVGYINDAFREIRRMRPDIVRAYFRTSLPTYSDGSPSVSVGMDEQYRKALVYYMVGMAQLRDDEATQDSRAAGFLNKFVSIMTTGV